MNHDNRLISLLFYLEFFSFLSASAGMLPHDAATFSGPCSMNKNSFGVPAGRMTEMPLPTAALWRGFCHD
jgi:hypothetical protein